MVVRLLLLPTQRHRPSKIGAEGYLVRNARKLQMPTVEIQTFSELTCPQCGHREVETMPTDACLFYYECKSCDVLLKPLAGDCCVFCSYGSVACPPIQQQKLTGKPADFCQ